MTDEPTIGGPPDIPGFRHEAWLGSGGFADVFRYRQVDLERSVAVKVLHGFDDGAREAFRSEAHVMARLSSHPSVVPIYQVGESDDGRPYLVMQLCPPPHLADRLRGGGLGIPEALTAGVQLAGALETAHRLGVLHRDIKPANILFSEFGRPMLADFGIAHTATSSAALHAFSPAWAPPEQIAGAAPTPQTDVYALCVTLTAMVTGHAPDPARAADLADAPADLRDLLRAGLAADPHDRPGSALFIGRALQRVQHQLSLPVTAIELWDGDDRHGEHPPSAGPLAPATPAEPVAPVEQVGSGHPRVDATRPDDRTHLLSLPTRAVVHVPTTPQRPTAQPAASFAPDDTRAAVSPAPVAARPTPQAPAEAGPSAARPDLDERHRSARRASLTSLVIVLAALALLAGLGAGIWLTVNRITAPALPSRGGTVTTPVTSPPTQPDPAGGSTGEGSPVAPPTTPHFPRSATSTTAPPPAATSTGPDLGSGGWQP